MDILEVKNGCCSVYSVHFRILIVVEQCLLRCHVQATRTALELIWGSRTCFPLNQEEPAGCVASESIILLRTFLAHTWNLSPVTSTNCQTDFLNPVYSLQRATTEPTLQSPSPTSEGRDWQQLLLLQQQAFTGQQQDSLGGMVDWKHWIRLVSSDCSFTYSLFDANVKLALARLDV